MTIFLMTAFIKFTWRYFSGFNALLLTRIATRLNLYLRWQNPAPGLRLPLSKGAAHLMRFFCVYRFMVGWHRPLSGGPLLLAVVVSYVSSPPITTVGGKPLNIKRKLS
jgi:hypothetical protein